MMEIVENSVTSKEQYGYGNKVSVCLRSPDSAGCERSDYLDFRSRRRPVMT